MAQVPHISRRERPYQIRIVRSRYQRSSRGLQLRLEIHISWPSRWVCMQVLCARWSILLLTLDRQTIAQPATTQYRTGKSKCIRMPRCRASNRTRNCAWSIGSLHSRMLYDNPSLELTRNKRDSSGIAASELVPHALKSESLTITRLIDIRVNKQCGLGLDSTTILSIHQPGLAQEPKSVYGRRRSYV